MVQQQLKIKSASDLTSQLRIVVVYISELSEISAVKSSNFFVTFKFDSMNLIVKFIDIFKIREFENFFKFLKFVFSSYGHRHAVYITMCLINISSG
jgi:hypothetical protein